MLQLCVAAFILSFTVRAETGDYLKIVDAMRDTVTDNPGIVSLFSIGDNEDGVPIYALRISSTPLKADPKKIANIIVATHHGNERQAPVLAMALVDALIQQYQSPLLYKSSYADKEWVVVPVLNISGYNASRRQEYRKDSNRNYAGPCHSGTPTLQSVKLLVDHLKTRTYTASVTIHGYLGALTYPWGLSSSNTNTLDENRYNSITRIAAALNGYRYGTSTEIVYPVNGSYEDYVYWKHGIWSWLVELKDGSPQDIKDTTEAVLYFFDKVDSSPSSKNQLQGRCSHTYSLDLHNE